MRTLSTPLLAAILLAAAAPALAAPAPAAKHATAAAPAASAGGVESDVRCLLTMVALSSNKERQQAGQVGVYFFAGRISARAPNLDLAAAMKTEVPTLGPAQLQVELPRCGQLVQTAAQKTETAVAGLRPPGPPPAAPAPAPAAPAPK